MTQYMICDSLCDYVLLGEEAIADINAYCRERSELPLRIAELVPAEYQEYTDAEELEFSENLLNQTRELEAAARFYLGCLHDSPWARGARADALAALEREQEFTRRFLGRFQKRYEIG